MFNVLRSAYVLLMMYVSQKLRFQITLSTFYLSGAVSQMGVKVAFFNQIEDELRGCTQPSRS